MAFLNRISSVLKQTVSKHMNTELSASNMSHFQAIRSMSSSKLFIGGLSYGTDEMSLREAFSQHGEVIEARIIMDRETGRSRGFGFVTYTSSEEASSAMQAMDGQDLHGRRIRVNYATEKPRGGGFRGGFGGDGGFGYGGGGGNYGGSGGYGNNSYCGQGGYGNNSYGGTGGYGNNSYGGAGGYGNPSNYGGAGGNLSGGGGGDGDGDGNSSFSGGAAYAGNNYNNGGVSNYAGGDAAPAASDYFNSGIHNDDGLATSGFDQGKLDGDQRDTVAGDEDFEDHMEGNKKDDDDAPDSYANTRS